MKTFALRPALNYSLLLIVLLLMSIEVHAQTTWDFETGDLRGWTAEGIAFGRGADRRQPTFDNNVRSRLPGITINHQGQYWIGTYENRPNASRPIGNIQGDTPRGTLTSASFVIRRRFVAFLIGGGNDVRNLRVELQILMPRNVGDPTMPSRGLVYSTVLSSTGHDSEVMRRETWDVGPYVGMGARIRIVDNSSRPWGHINCDDFRFIDDAVGDLSVTGMEITQAVQVYPDNSIPLVGYKLTFVRVYIASREDTRGPWLNVTGRLRIRNRSGAHAGAPIPERTLLPINGSGGRIAVAPSGSDRNSLNDSLLYALDYDQTAPGERELEIEVFEASGRTEASSSNNMLAQPYRAKFSAANHRSIVGFTYANRNTGSGCSNRAPDGYRPSSTDFDAHNLYVQNMHPVSSLALTRLPGNPQRSFDNSDCTAYIPAHNWLAATIDRLYPTGGSRGYLLTPENNGYNGWCCNGANGNSIARGENFRSDFGPTMAHEVAHSWGRLHTPSVPGASDSNFPRANGSVGQQTGMRTFPSLQPVPPVMAGGAALGDIMSYTSPFWISPYTYCGLIDAMFGGTLTCPTTAITAQYANPPFTNRATSTGLLTRPHFLKSLIASQDLRVLSSLQTQAFLYVAGSINPDGKAAFEPFEMITTSENIGSKTASGAYLLVLEGKGKEILRKHAFSPPPDYDSQHRSPRRFSMFIPYHQDTSRVVLYRDNRVLAERTVSANFPEIKLSPLEGKKSWTGKHKISWQASDADNDRVTFSVYYSSDGGYRWVPLNVGFEQNSLEVDFDNLPGADQGMMRVVASDGINTSEARYSQSFVVPRKSPQVNVAQTRLGNIGSTNIPKVEERPLDKHEISLPENEFLILSASAIDWEDGPITAHTAFAWNSDRDGALGYGQWIVLRKLSPGRHSLTLTVYDSDKLEGRVTIQINVRGQSKAARR